MMGLQLEFLALTAVKGIMSDPTRTRSFSESSIDFCAP